MGVFGEAGVLKIFGVLMGWVCGRVLEGAGHVFLPSFDSRWVMGKG
jgi:hypothetical protein